MKKTVEMKSRVREMKRRKLSQQPRFFCPSVSMLQAREPADAPSTRTALARRKSVVSFCFSVYVLLAYWEKRERGLCSPLSVYTSLSPV